MITINITDKYSINISTTSELDCCVCNATYVRISAVLKINIETHAPSFKHQCINETYVFFTFNDIPRVNQTSFEHLLTAVLS